MSNQIIVPSLGESITEATVSKWLKQVGEKVSSDEPLVELETDKVNVEVPSPLSGTLLAHFFTSNEKLNIFKSVGVVIGFLGILFLFFDKLVISESNIFYVIVILCGSTFYVVGGILTLKFLKNKGNENVTTSTILWSLIFHLK